MSSLSPSPETQARKARSCRTCGEPMKGHPRGPCRTLLPGSLQSSPAPLDNAGTPPPPLRAPDGRPIMPGTYDRNDRPSVVSNPSPTLLARIGPKVEVDEGGMPFDPSYQLVRYGHDIDREHNGFRVASTSRRRGSTPLQAMPTIRIGSSASTIFPDHSVSQRYIRRDRGASEAPGRLADRLGGSVHDSYDDDDDDARYLSDDADVGTPDFDSRSEAGTIRSTSTTFSQSFSALLRASGASPLAGVYEVAGKYAPFVRRRARAAGLHEGVLQKPDHEDPADVYGHDYYAGPRREPGNVFVVLGRDGDAVRQLVSRSPECNEIGRAHPTPNFANFAPPRPAPLQIPPASLAPLQIAQVPPVAQASATTGGATACQLLTAALLGAFALVVFGAVAFLIFAWS